jgi:glycosyltransferase involved in cell wall biosynthesis
VLGLRGFPGVEGGVERHAEHLYPLMAERGCRVDVIVRSPYWSRDRECSWRGVEFHSIWAPRQTGLEALVHSFLGALYAAVVRPDVLHVQAIGPAIVTPLARLLGLRVVVTHHGPDYDREKWGRFARWVLRLGERAGMVFANERIVISRVIQSAVQSKYGRESTLIPNGVVVPDLPVSVTALEGFSLTPRRYILNVSRFVPEKRHEDLIAAFRQADLPGWKLVLVGSTEKSNPYVRRVMALAKDHDDIVFTGFQNGTALKELYTHAGMFILPSSHEGLPIALLEALSFGLPVLASDIPANLEIGLKQERYFRVGNVAELASRLHHFAGGRFTDSEREEQRAWVRDHYNWNTIAEATRAVYERVLAPRKWAR